MTRSPGSSPLEHFDVIGVAAAEPDLALGRAVAARVDHEHPVAAGVVEEGAVGDQQRLDGSPSVSLAWTVWPRCTDGRLGADEHQVDLELAVADLRIDLGDLAAG